MKTIAINTSELRHNIYLFTAAKSRFVEQGRTNQELYTLDMEDDIREASAQLSEDIGGILITDADIPNSTSQKVDLRVTLCVNNSNPEQTDWPPVLLHLDGVILAVPVSYGQITEGGPAEEFNAKQIADFFLSHEEIGWECSRVGETVTLIRNRQDVALDELTTYVDGLDLNGMMIECTLSFTSDKVKIATLSYTTEDIKSDIITLTKQKGKVTDKNGVSLMDKIAFNTGTTDEHVITPSKANVFTLCKLISARKAQGIVEQGKGKFDTYVMTSDDTILFNAFYSRAFSDMLGELSVLISEFTIDHTTDPDSFTVNAGLPGAVATSLASNVEQYLFSHIMGQFYRLCSLPDEAKESTGEAGGHLLTIKNMISSQADGVELLKNIITDAAVKVQTALYPLSKRSPGTNTMYDYGETSLDFTFQLSDIPISSSSVQLIYNLGRSVLVNGALAKLYTMLGTPDDKNEAKAEMDLNLSTIAYLIEDRLRFLGLFDQLLLEGGRKVRTKMLAYSKHIEESDFTLENGVLSFNFENSDWEAEGVYSDNFVSVLKGSIQEAIYRYILMEWWRITYNKEFQTEMQNYNKAMVDVSGALNVRHSPKLRSVTWM